MAPTLTEWGLWVWVVVGRGVGVGGEVGRPHRGGEEELGVATARGKVAEIWGGAMEDVAEEKRGRGSRGCG